MIYNANYIWHLLYGSITIDPHKWTKNCWLTQSKHSSDIGRVLTVIINKFSVFDMTRHEGCVLYVDYHQNMSNMYFYRSDLPFPSLTNNPVSIKGTTWSGLLGCSPEDTLPPTTVEFPLRFKWRHSRRYMAFSSSSSFEIWMNLKFEHLRTDKATRCQIYAVTLRECRC